MPAKITGYTVLPVGMLGSYVEHDEDEVAFSDLSIAIY